MKGNVWIGGNGRGGAPEGARARHGAGRGRGAAGAAPIARAAPAPGRRPPPLYHDKMILKFTQDGKFLMQIGHPGQSKGSNDTEKLRAPAKMFIDPKTNEIYVADGYGNKRVIVFDADTGKYKRHWGAYGNKPDDTDLGHYIPDAPPAQQFRNPVHCAELSNDDMLYVCDRVNDRIQVFKTRRHLREGEGSSTRTRSATDRCGTSRSRRIRSRSSSIWRMAPTKRSTSSIANR